MLLDKYQHSSYLVVHLICVVKITLLFLFSIDVKFGTLLCALFATYFTPVVCRTTHVLFTIFVYGDVQHINHCAYVLFVLALCLVYSNVAIFSGLSFHGSPFGILYRLLIRRFKLKLTVINYSIKCVIITITNGRVKPKTMTIASLPSSGMRE